MDGVKEMFLAEEPVPDVILTGGASAMPFVAQLIQEKLDVMPVNSAQPSYTVSRGLPISDIRSLRSRKNLQRLVRLSIRCW